MKSKISPVKKKKKFQKPQLKSQEILTAGLAVVCNGTVAAGRKAINPCTQLKT
jgi:hypothetical protein